VLRAGGSSPPKRTKICIGYEKFHDLFRMELFSYIHSSIHWFKSSQIVSLIVDSDYEVMDFKTALGIFAAATSLFGYDPYF
jgi:hypothetical protein